ncbi:MAG TPA: NAD(P) transhydrogenase subunit alpha [Firmicutes bacterium]|nr:NAD(P) transhydrogenase subunit alpha [Bacillota bacterium]
MYLGLLISLIASALLGYRVISSVPPLLHTPLMSGMNALSGIIVIGALTAYANSPAGARLWTGLAITAAMINLVGGFWVTDRMLRMFHRQDENGAEQERS